MDGPSLSVVICTLDRAELLRGCLDALAGEVPANGTVEVIVVDNGSTDHTPAVAAAHPFAALVHEPVRGLARARNRGLAASHGDVVAYLDDDARTVPGWAAALLDARRTWPEAAVFGGPVRLEWAAARPRWLIPSLEPWFSAVDHGRTTRPLAEQEHLVGANLAVVRERAAAVGGFATTLGRVGPSLASNEELDLVRRLRAAGGGVVWVPGAAVRHLVGRERMTRRWLLRRGWAQGRSDRVAAALEGAAPGVDVRSAVGALARGWRHAARRVRRDVASGAVVHELVRRARVLGRAL
jgi:glycosyltransferase involved in cell wall biosynthesis